MRYELVRAVADFIPGDPVPLSSDDLVFLRDLFYHLDSLSPSINSAVAGFLHMVDDVLAAGASRDTVKTLLRRLQSLASQDMIARGLQRDPLMRERILTRIGMYRNINRITGNVVIPIDP